jgi:hypothetical protein
MHWVSGIRSTAGLVGSSARVGVGPPLFCRPWGVRSGAWCHVVLVALNSEGGRTGIVIVRVVALRSGSGCSREAVSTAIVDENGAFDRECAVVVI